MGIVVPVRDAKNTTTKLEMTQWDTTSHICEFRSKCINTLRPRQNGRHFTGDTFNRLFVNKNVRIAIKFSLKFVPKGPISNIPALVQIMTWRRQGANDDPVQRHIYASLGLNELSNRI